MTEKAYQQLCERLARKASRYAAEMAEEEDPTNVTDERTHWLEVFLDEHLPDLAPDMVLAVTKNKNAYKKAMGHRAPSREIGARHALQADVWDAINKFTP